LENFIIREAKESQSLLPFLSTPKQHTHSTSIFYNTTIHYTDPKPHAKEELDFLVSKLQEKDSSFSLSSNKIGI
jgi:hypothetical protein